MWGFKKTLIRGTEIKGLNKISLTWTFLLFFKNFVSIEYDLYFFKIIFVLQEMLNNETNYSNGEF